MCKELEICQYLRTTFGFYFTSLSFHWAHSDRSSSFDSAVTSVEVVASSLWEWDSGALWNFSTYAQTQTKKKSHCVSFHWAQASALTDIVFSFSLQCSFRMIIVQGTQCVNSIIVRGARLLLWSRKWPARTPDDLTGKEVTSDWPSCLSWAQTLMEAGLQFWWPRRRRAERWSCTETTNATMCRKFPLKGNFREELTSVKTWILIQHVWMMLFIKLHVRS